MDSTFFSSLPKIEIHNHLEGTITPRTLQKLAKKITLITTTKTEKSW